MFSVGWLLQDKVNVKMQRIGKMAVQLNVGLPDKSYICDGNQNDEEG